MTVTSNTVTVIIKQEDENGLEKGKREIAIKRKGEDTWSEWITVDSDTYIFEELRDGVNITQDTEYEVKTRATDEAGNVTESKVSTIKTEKLQKPSVTIPDKSWTNDKVEVVIEFPSASGKVTNEYSTDGTTWKPVTGNKTTIYVTENNTTVYARIKDSTNQVSETASAQITCIERTLPEITSYTKSTDAPTNQAVVLTAKAIDRTSGIVAYQFTTNENITKESTGWTKITSTKNEITVTYDAKANDKYYIYVLDDAGNIAKKEIEVTSYDITKPTVESINVTSPNTGSYQAGQKVTIIATFSENVKGTVPTLKIKFGTGEERSITTGTVSGNTITYTYEIVSVDNGELVSTGYTGGALTDLAGNAAVIENKTLGGNKITALNAITYNIVYKSSS